MGALGLPAVPAELKPITPYLQRAEEVKATDAIISYWCTLILIKFELATHNPSS